MLTNIYARSMMTATRHADLPERALPGAYRAPERRPSRLARWVKSLGGTVRQR